MKIVDKEIQADYKNRINRVFEFIDQNLESDLSLNTVSKIAFFSPFHFHRIFKFITRETLNEYVTRRKIEKSASDLLHKNITTTEIAHKYGFSDNSSFSRTFKKYYGVSPTKFKKQNINRYSKICQLESKNGQEYPNSEKYICIINNLKKWIKMNAKIEIKKMPEQKIAYASCIGVQNIKTSFDKVIQWATPKGLINKHTKMATIYHDSFKITEVNKVRISTAILLEQDYPNEGEIATRTIKAGKHIMAHFEITIDQFEKSWTGLFVWMNENGYEKADNDPFEIYHNDFEGLPNQIAIVDFYIPIK